MKLVDRRSNLFLIFFFLSLLGFSTEQQHQPSISLPERLTLLQLRSSLGLRAREWRIRSDPCASWPGIQCDSGGRVSGINISGFKRTRRGGQNPQFSVDALRNLTILSSFNASDFALPGPIPDWFGTQLLALRVLDLRSCSISGAIPPTLGNLSSLVQLYLSRNNLTGVIPSSLSQLVGLNGLDLAENSLTGTVPASLVALRNLTVLDLSNNFLSGVIPREIGAISGLQSLNLGFNSLSGALPLDLENLRNLRRLIIGSNTVSGGLPGNLFSPLSQLELLDLSRNGFTGEFPDILWSLPSLRFLDVSVNNFSGVLPNVSSRVNNNSSARSVFNISRNSFYGNITPVIRGFSLVDMSGNYFEGPVPIYARGSTSLVSNCLRNLTGQRSLSECTSFYGDRNLSFDNFGEPNGTQPLSPSRPANRSNSRLIIILASVFGGLGLVALVILTIVLVIACRRRRGRGNTNQSRAGISVGPVPGTGGSSPAPVVFMDFSKLGDAFTYQQILQATSEFNNENLLKNSHSGDLFRAALEGGVQVVIKKIDLNSSVKKELYMSELDVFSKVSSHPRLVPLLGYCLENEDEKFIVYKHMPNGDLSSSLFRKTSGLDDSLQSLDWITRLKIAIGVAEGLSYFHHECTPPLVHRDIQASSILLDDKYEVRLGSLSEVCAQEGDTHQSRITRLLRFPQSTDQGASGTPNATCAYDVYCFGKVLLELVTGNLGISSSVDPTTKEWLDATLSHISIYDKELVISIVDPSLIIDEDLLEEVWAMAVVARSCLNPKPNRRPLMRYILKALENPLKVVRDEQHTSSERFRTMSSRGSWNAALFGSWRHNSSDVAANPAAAAAAARIVEGSSSGKRSGTTGSQNGEGNNGNSSSARRQSREIFPEPLDEHVD